MTDWDLARLARLVDRLEEQAPRYLGLDDVRTALPEEAHGVLRDAIAADLLLVDERISVDAATGARTPVTLCRLNRRHPLARALLEESGGPPL